MVDEPAKKRRKVDAKPAVGIDTTAVVETLPPARLGRVMRGTLHRPISPPVSRKAINRKSSTYQVQALSDGGTAEDEEQSPPVLKPQTQKITNYISSPFRLTRIHDLKADKNVDAIGLRDILGDPMIKECWNFNFLFDLDFVM